MFSSEGAFLLNVNQNSKPERGQCVPWGALSFLSSPLSSPFIPSLSSLWYI